MAYSADVVSRATRLLEQQKADSVSRYNQRLFEAYAKVPRIRQIDAQLRLNMAEATQAILMPWSGPRRPTRPSPGSGRN